MFYWRGEQREAIKTALAGLKKLQQWDAGLPTLKPKSKLAHALILPNSPLTPLPGEAAALVSLLEWQLGRTATKQVVVNVS